MKTEKQRENTRPKEPAKKTESGNENKNNKQRERFHERATERERQVKRVRGTKKLHAKENARDGPSPFSFLARSFSLSDFLLRYFPLMLQTCSKQWYYAE